MFFTRTVAPVMLLMVSSHALAQRPLATTEVAGKQLELWAFEHLKWMDAKTAGYTGASESMRSLLQDELQAEPEILWEDNVPSVPMKRNHLALGFLLRDQSGKIASDSISMSEAHQVIVEGQQHSFRRRMDKPSDGFCHCKWSYNMLSPLVVVTGDESQPQAKSIEKLNGFVSIQPQVSAMLTFTADELQSRQRKSAGLFSIEPIDSEQLADGTVYRFQMFYPKPTSEGQSLSAQMFLQASSMLPQVIVEKKNGEIAQPSGQMRFSASRQLQSKIRAAFKTEIRLRKQDPESIEAVREISFKYNLDVDLFAIKIPSTDVLRIRLTPTVAVGLPTVHSFEMSSIALDQSPEPQQIVSMIETTMAAAANSNDGLRAHSGQSGESAMLDVSDTIYRTWRDTSGKFSVEATLVSNDGTSVSLRRKDGKTVKVPIERLSLRDIMYLEDVGNK